MRYLVSSSKSQIVFFARQKLGLTQKEMAEAIGSSLRTVSRWEARESSPDHISLQKLAALLHPAYPELAHDAALASGKTLEQLGIVAPAPPPPAPEPARAPSAAPPLSPPSSGAATPATTAESLPAHLLVDAVVYAALEALEGARIPLSTLRAVLFAAFARARDLRLDTGAVSGALAPAKPDAPIAPAPTPTPSASPAAATVAAAPEAAPGPLRRARRGRVNTR